MQDRKEGTIIRKDEGRKGRKDGREEGREDIWKIGGQTGRKERT